MLLKNKEMEEANCTFAIPKPDGRHKAGERGSAEFPAVGNFPRPRRDGAAAFLGGTAEFERQNSALPGSVGAAVDAAAVGRRRNKPGICREINR